MTSHTAPSVTGDVAAIYHTAPAPLVIDPISESNYDNLMAEVERVCLAHCESISLFDDTIQNGSRVLEFEVITPVYTGGYDRDEDGHYPNTERGYQVVSVAVSGGMGISQVAQAALSKVQAIEGNVFA